MILVSGKARSLRVLPLSCRGAESPDWFDVLPEISAWDVMHEQVLSWWHHLSPVARGCSPWVIWIVSAEQCSSLTQNLMLICSTYSVIFNATATQYSCSLSGVYHPHWLVQWSCHCSHMRIPVHSPWLPSYVDVSTHHYAVQTFFVILTIAELFLDRPHINM